MIEDNYYEGPVNNSEKAMIGRRCWNILCVWIVTELQYFLAGGPAEEDLQEMTEAELTAAATQDNSRCLCVDIGEELKWDSPRQLSLEFYIFHLGFNRKLKIRYIELQNWE